VGRTLLRATDRLFGVFARSVSGKPFVTSVRRVVVRRLLAPALSRPGLRARAFHFVSQLGIRYRASPAVTEGEPRLRRGPRAGDRLPDARVHRAGRSAYLQEELSRPRIILLLCGPVSAWNADDLAVLVNRFRHVLEVTCLSRDDAEGVLVDVDGDVLAQLGVESTAQYVIRPDGHVGFRCAGTDLTSVTEYLQRWFAPVSRGLKDGAEAALRD
jgi:hypothetical protein